MQHRRIIELLSANKIVFEGLLSNKTSEEYLWKPQENKWCLLEIVCHLFDEEREDFKTRVRYTLETPEKELPKFDPVSWVKDRNYIKQDYDDKVKQFLKERSASVEWLQSLDNPIWTNAYQHPKLGPLSAEHFLSNWLAHDILHIRQIITLQFQYLQNSTGRDLSYAGNW